MSEEQTGEEKKKRAHVDHVDRSGVIDVMMMRVVTVVDGRYAMLTGRVLIVLLQSGEIG